MNDYSPKSYSFINAYNTPIKPSTVHCSDNALTAYYQKYLFQEAMSIFDWNLPKTWAKNFFLYVLYGIGYVCVFDGGKYGVIPQYCTLSGYNVFYQPKHALVTNPLFRDSKELLIHKECAIIQLQPDYHGILDAVNYFATMLALCSQSTAVNLINSKVALVFTAKNKASAEAFKKLYDAFSSGEPCVVQDKTLQDDLGNNSWDVILPNIGQNFIAGDILDTAKKIKNDFNTFFGIPNANTQKKERLISDEVNANNQEVLCKKTLWFEELKRGVDEAKSLFDIPDFDVKIREFDNTAGGGDIVY